MKFRILLFFAGVSVVLSACGQGIRFADTTAGTKTAAVGIVEVESESGGGPATDSQPVEQTGAAPVNAVPAETENPTPAEEAAAQPAESEIVPLETPAAEPAAEVAAPAPVASASAPAASAPAPISAPGLSNGAIPFSLAAGTEQWWQIDASDSAYWAVQENINAIRAAAGLSPLSMDAGLSAIAGARCESFVAGGPFDHSGMATASEICASGPLGSAGTVCAAWQASPAHYAAMTGNFSSMGVGCWFCSTAEGNYTYWCVTFA